MNKSSWKRDIDTMLKEFKQLNEGVTHVSPVIAFVNPYELIDKERRRSLEAVNMIKEKK